MIVLLGVIGSGKSEQAERLGNRIGAPRISTSQLLRDTQDERIKQTILEGRLVNDEDVIKLLDEAITTLHGESKDIILDGAPRSVPQAQWLVKKAKSREIKDLTVINIDVPKETVLQRLASRGREDDDEKVVVKRFEEYERATKPVIDYLEQQGIKVNHVEGNDTRENVEEQIRKVVGK